MDNSYIDNCSNTLDAKEILSKAPSFHSLCNNQFLQLILTFWSNISGRDGSNRHTTKFMIDGLKYFENWITEEEEASLLSEIYKMDWELSLKRRVQQFGKRYDYTNRALHEAPDLPSYLNPHIERISQFFESNPDQIIINEYKIGQGIGPHRDAACFGPTVASLSLQNAATMIFKNQANSFSLPLKPRSLVIISGLARTDWTHEIPKVINPRVSITFRTSN